MQTGKDEKFYNIASAKELENRIPNNVDRSINWYILYSKQFGQQKD